MSRESVENSGEDVSRFIAVLHVDRNEWITIDPTTDCRRCGVKSPHGIVTVNSLDSFKICEFHCAGCQSTSPIPNPLCEWRDKDGASYQAPCCSECYLPPLPDMSTLSGTYVKTAEKCSDYVDDHLIGH